MAWRTGVGGAYCAACPSRCAKCPRQESKPVSFEGRHVWDLVLRIGHPLRVTEGAVVSFDFTAVLALAAAMGVNLAAVAEWLPAIESVAVREMNKSISDRTMGNRADG